MKFSKSAPACFVLARLRLLDGGGVLGGEEDLMLLEGGSMTGTPASCSSSSEAEGASNIGESSSGGRDRTAVSGVASNGDICE